MRLSALLSPRFQSLSARLALRFLSCGETVIKSLDVTLRVTSFSFTRERKPHDRLAAR